MFDPSRPDAIQQPFNNGYDESSAEEVLAAGKLLADAGPSLGNSDRAVKIARHLISTYNMICKERCLRDSSAEITARLAGRYDEVLDLVIGNAKAYAEIQHIDDAHPFSPNSFDVLSKLERSDKRVIQFLRQTVQDEHGIPQREALSALRKLNDRA